MHTIVDIVEVASRMSLAAYKRVIVLVCHTECRHAYVLTHVLIGCCVVRVHTTQIANAEEEGGDWELFARWFRRSYMSYFTRKFESFLQQAEVHSPLS